MSVKKVAEKRQQYTEAEKLLIARLVPQFEHCKTHQELSKSIDAIWHSEHKDKKAPPPRGASSLAAYLYREVKKQDYHSFPKVNIFSH